MRPMYRRSPSIMSSRPKHSRSSTAAQLVQPLGVQPDERVLLSAGAGRACRRADPDPIELGRGARAQLVQALVERADVVLLALAFAFQLVDAYCAPFESCVTGPSREKSAGQSTTSGPATAKQVAPWAQTSGAVSRVRPSSSRVSSGMAHVVVRGSGTGSHRPSIMR